MFIRRNHTTVKQMIVGLVTLVVVVYLGALAALWFGQERLLFHPTPIDPARNITTGPDIHERVINVPGARLSVLELRLTEPKGVVFFLHGNAGNLETWFVNPAFYRKANYDLVMLDYRGYGKSTGRIESEAQLHADVQAVWDEVAPRYTGRRVVVYGRSLGSGLAARLAVRIQPDLTMLVSPYVSLAAISREQFPWVPGPVLRYPLRTDEALPGIRRPVMLIHGERDDLIPPTHSQALKALVPSVTLAMIPDANHNDLQKFESYLEVVSAALRAL